MSGTVASDSAGLESAAYDDVYDCDEDYYEDDPRGLPAPAEDGVLPPAPAAYDVEEDGYIDGDLVEMLIGIMPQGLYDAGVTETDYMKARPYMTEDGTVSTHTERELLFAPAALLLGTGWQSKLARICGYSQGHLQQVYRGKRAVTDELKTELLNAYRDEIERHEERACRGWAGIIKILDSEQKMAR